MKIESNSVATLVYSIHLNDVYGKLIENAQNEPKDLMFGFGKMITGFEEGLLAKKAGDDFSFEIEPAKAFGEYRSDVIIDVPKSAFMVNGKLRDDLIYLEDLEPKSGCGCGSGGGCSTDSEHEHSGCGCSTEKEHSHEDGGCGCGSGCGC